MSEDHDQTREESEDREQTPETPASPEAGAAVEIETREILAAGHEPIEVPTRLPLLPVRDVVIYPGVTVPLAIGRPRSLAALAVAGDEGFLLIATQRDPTTDDPSLEELYPVGCIVRVVRVIDAKREGRQAIVVGVARTRILPSAPGEALHPIDPLDEHEPDSSEVDAIWQRVVGLAHRVIDLHDDYPEEWKSFVQGIPTAGLLADLIASTLPLPPEERVALLEEALPSRRLARIAQHLEREVTIAETQRALSADGDEEIDPARRERLLRRRLRDIEDELGEGDPGIREVEELRERIEAAELPEAAKSQAERELQRLSALPQHAPDRHLIRTYVEWLADLPWSVETEDKLDLAAARIVLDDDHHDLEKVKERILEFLAVRKLAPGAKSPILCFVGPPGVGKTSLGRSIARAMGREFVRISLGGVRDEAEIRGHRRTYVGALPGRVLQGLKQAATRNPVFMLDEIDKLGSDFRGDPSSALLEVLDPEQNARFSDHYLNVAFDLSGVFFIATANLLDPIPGPLRDRMEVIRLPGYTPEEKQEIARSFLIPRQTEENGLPASRIEWSDAALRRIITEYTYEAGVRGLERRVAAICRKAARRAAEGDASSLRLTRRTLERYLGPASHPREELASAGEVGVANGLAWTEAGGDLLRIEVVVTHGRGLTLTGQLGEVMKESAHAALTYVRSRSTELGLDDALLTRHQVHVHVPAGAIPKDGPSAGVTMATALASLASGAKVRPDVAMTGEVTLRGRVLPVGGVREKALAALRSGIRTVILPRHNLGDLREIPAELARRIRFVGVTHMDEVLEAALEAPPRARRPRVRSAPAAPTRSGVATVRSGGTS